MLDYVSIPPGASPLPSSLTDDSRQHARKHSASHASDSAPPLSPALPESPNSPRSSFNLTNILLSSAVHLPTTSPSSPRKTSTQLLTNRDPLSVPITTVNFRRFVARSGVIFWTQDRLEEILFWKRGWKLTAAWLAGYTFLCYHPKLVLLLPHVATLSIMLANRDNAETPAADGSKIRTKTVPPFPSLPAEGSVQWFSTLQAIQNVLGAVSDGYDLIVPLTPYLAPSSPFITSLFILTLLSVPIVLLIPLRLSFLFVGIFPFVLTHPYVLPHIPTLYRAIVKPMKSHFRRFMDNDNLQDRHWFSELREVELWENERWSQQHNNWSKHNLKATDRNAWTRGSDGFSGVADTEGEVRNLTFQLEPGWRFVETEDWREDLIAIWNSSPSDDNGWVYSDDSWQGQSSVPLPEWLANGATRRRRWTRRIYRSLPGN
ncbi:hypothetical protein SISSUDRAFT_1124094 [Sistotremastrum suecicum HHB10207 ss-3]|uniref:TECPR1-like DysF domain-containing protein n=1 Tax=Sistotremastrum suecicum HHB10207 ss-3 TaxID=1314776 RepID=A0A166JCN0_9AGAM|nr:hypothetical protein SISSUDRAFT_1124094 [Sistotremastrum suecicum HHB10207 ss-3]